MFQKFTMHRRCQHSALQVLPTRAAAGIAHVENVLNHCVGTCHDRTCCHGMRCSSVNSCETFWGYAAAARLRRPLRPPLLCWLQVPCMYVFVDIGVNMRHMVATVRANFPAGTALALAGTIQFGSSIQACHITKACVYLASTLTTPLPPDAGLS